MSVELNNASVYTDFQGLAELKRGARKQTPESIRETARQFEGLFLQMMLKSMRTASLGEGLMDNDQSKLYMEMFDKQVAMDMAKGKGIGMADMLFEQLGGNKIQGAEMVNPPESSPQLMRHAFRSYGMTPPTSQFYAENPQSFIQQLWPYAQRAAEELGVNPRALVAQAALETGWGQSMIKTQDGRNSLNFFGIKAGQSWQGERVTTTTHEFEAGQRKALKDDFRVYDTVEQSFSDYVAFLKGNSRYQDALQAGAGHDVAAYVEGLQKSGYATDPQYASKILNIADRDTFIESIALAKNTGKDVL